MPNPRGINQYSGGKGAGTFRHGTKSASSSGKSDSSKAHAANARAHAATLRAQNRKNKKG